MAGHEHDGYHPVLVVGRGAMNDGQDLLVLPATSPSKEHENWWEVNVDCERSCALVDGLRTVRISDLGKWCLALADGWDLCQVRHALRRLLLESEPLVEDEFVRGAVYKVTDAGNFYGADKVLILRYNSGNDVAMVMKVDESRPGAVRLAVPILSLPALAGVSILPSYVCSFAASERLGECLGPVSGAEVRSAVDYLLGIASPLPNLIAPS